MLCIRWPRQHPKSIFNLLKITFSFLRASSFSCFAAVLYYSSNLPIHFPSLLPSFDDILVFVVSRERERIFHPLYLVHFCRCCLTSLIPTYENITSDADSALCYCGMCVRFRTWITTTRVKLSRSTKQQEKIHCRFYFIFLLGFFFRKRVKYFRINACNMPWDHSLYFCQFVWRWMETFSCETETTKMMMMMAGGREELSTIRLGSAAVTLISHVSTPMSFLCFYFAQQSEFESFSFTEERESHISYLICCVACYMIVLTLM